MKVNVAFLIVIKCQLKWNVFGKEVALPMVMSLNFFSFHFPFADAKKMERQMTFCWQQREQNFSPEGLVGEQRESFAHEKFCKEKLFTKAFDKNTSRKTNLLNAEENPNLKSMFVDFDWVLQSWFRITLKWFLILTSNQLWQNIQKPKSND